MSDPVSDLKRQLLAAAERQQEQAILTPKRRQDRRRWPLVALASVILVCGLLVTPAFGIGDRLLSLIQSKPHPARRAGSCLVARRADDRVRELARRQRRGLRHGRRRQRASEPHAAPGEGCPPCLVARRTEDRVREPPRRQLRGLRHERRREREAEPHAGSGAATTIQPGHPTGARSRSCAAGSTATTLAASACTASTATTYMS